MYVPTLLQRHYCPFSDVNISLFRVLFTISIKQIEDGVPLFCTQVNVYIFSLIFDGILSSVW